jgi:hypothetical protein
VSDFQLEMTRRFLKNTLFTSLINYFYNDITPPYLFLNLDGQTFTYFGLYVDRTTGSLIDPSTGHKLFDDLTISKALIQGIELQDRHLPRENIADMSKKQKIYKLL